MKATSRTSIGDRLTPCILDKLLDYEPLIQKESIASRTLTKNQYKVSVLRDVQWLLNTINSASEVDYNGFKYASQSVTNFGLPPLAGQRFSELDWVKLENMIRDAIITFEPRVVAKTVAVKAIFSADKSNHHNLLAFEIRGQIWYEPYPLELLLRSQIDLESGQVTIIDTISGERV
jgi:type VI secretion system protein ImpF